MHGNNPENLSLMTLVLVCNLMKEKNKTSHLDQPHRADELQGAEGHYQHWILTEVGSQAGFRIQYITIRVAAYDLKTNRKSTVACGDEYNCRLGLIKKKKHFHLVQPHWADEGD